jgi:hypothetical protein
MAVDYALKVTGSAGLFGRPQDRNAAVVPCMSVTTHLRTIRLRVDALMSFVLAENHSPQCGK